MEELAPIGMRRFSVRCSLSPEQLRCTGCWKLSAGDLKFMENSVQCKSYALSEQEVLVLCIFLDSGSVPKLLSPAGHTGPGRQRRQDQQGFWLGVR